MEAAGIDELVGRLNGAVEAGDVNTVTARVKDDLTWLLQSGRVKLPGRFRQTRADRYVRRLLHRDPALRYTAVVMAWGPGQQTQLHDHAGIWCVEGVVEGVMNVTQYALLEELDGAYRFTPQQGVRAPIASAGALIPPFEYHVLGNALADRSSVTLHVYGGELRECHVFELRPDGRYARWVRGLGYDE